MRMLITGGLVARADGVFNTDILIEGDRILELGERLHEAQQPEGTEIVDVSGCVVMPGGVDAHTHVNLTVGDARVSDGFEAGTLAAAWGGTTTIVEHPGFGPQGCDLPHQPTAYLEQLLTDKDSMTGRIEDAGLDAKELPGCSEENWKALADVIDVLVPASSEY